MLLGTTVCVGGTGESLEGGASNKSLPDVGVRRGEGKQTPPVARKLGHPTLVADGVVSRFFRLNAKKFQYRIDLLYLHLINI